MAGSKPRNYFWRDGLRRNKRRRLMYMCLSVTIALLLSGFSTKSQAADPHNGSKFYNRYCTTCHGNNGSPQLPGAPDFSRGERLLQPDNSLLKSIRSGIGMMPAYRGQLTDDEILDVIAYLRTLRR